MKYLIALVTIVFGFSLVLEVYWVQQQVNKQMDSINKIIVNNT